MNTTAFGDTNSKLWTPDEFLLGMRIRAAAYLLIASHQAVRHSLEKHAGFPGSEQRLPYNYCKWGLLQEIQLLSKTHRMRGFVPNRAM